MSCRGCELTAELSAIPARCRKHGGSVKHFNDHWAFTYVFATLVGLALGSILYQPLISTAYAVANAVGLR